MKKLLIALAVILVLAVAAVVIARQLVIGYVTPDFLVRQIESNWNCRADIKELKVTLMGDSGVHLQGVALAPRDQYADQRTPLADRPELPEGAAQITSASVLLEVEPTDLLKKRLNIKQLIIEQPVITTDVLEDGSATVQRLFDPVAPPAKPADLQVQAQTGAEPTVAVAPRAADTGGAQDEQEPSNAAAAPVDSPPLTADPAQDISQSQPQLPGNPADTDPVDPSAEPEEPPRRKIILPKNPGAAPAEPEAIANSEGGFKAGDFGMSAVATLIEIRDGKVIAHVKRGGARVTLDAFQLKLTSIDIDPAQLATNNNALFSFATHLTVDDADNKDRYAEANADGNGELTPFDPHTGLVEPRWACNLKVHQGSTLNTFPVIEKLNALLEKVDTAGVDLSGIQLRGNLLADAETRVAHDQGKFTLEKDFKLLLPDTGIQIHQASWIDSGTNQHQLNGSLLASEELTAAIKEKVDAYLQDKAKFLASESTREAILSPAMKDGRIFLEWVSQGDLGKPKVDLVTPFGNLSELLDQGKETLKDLKDVGKSLLEGLFK